ncbi:MAG: hypothetical protein U0M23_03735 [Acutalibacteraceae bacterium]|nr:hypothetical protein [Acutalibacteraceae bacterium]HIR03133.1 hypothetical protein [Candidatus Scatovicinus merdipullorum]
MLVLFVLLVVVIVAAVAYAKTADHGYTIGKGLFKSSDSCMDEKEADVCEHEYWNKNKLK